MFPIYKTVFDHKMERLRAGGAPRLLDICGGAGGFSLGFAAAHFELVGSVELDAQANLTYARNLHRDAPETRKELLRQVRNLALEAPQAVVSDLGTGPVNMAVDVIAAGLPCQAFARIGRSKLASLADDPQAYRKDARASLYKHFLRYVRVLKPVALIIENVPDILNYGGHNVPEEIIEALRPWGYRARYSILSAAAYGVPQFRQRLFLVAYHEVVGVLPRFPVPSHKAELPSGYQKPSELALRNARNRKLYVPAPTAPAFSPPAVSVSDALQDLQPILRRACAAAPDRKIEQLSPYCRVPSEYARKMRRWPRFETADVVTAHVARHTPRDYDTFATMGAGEQYPRAHAHAVARFEAELAKLAPSEVIAPGSPKWMTLRSRIVPPYDPAKFANKWRKLEPDRPSVTVTAHLGRDTYSHIHYDSAQARTISVREAARLQSFPDGFVFSGAMNSAFQQIGNAVPPLLALALALEIREAIQQQPYFVRKGPSSLRV